MAGFAGVVGHKPSLRVFGSREVELVEGPDGASALALHGYVRFGDAVIDAPTLLERWRHRGAAVLDQLSGEFAFAVRIGDELTVVRDPLGTRPLYVARLDSGRFAFASAIRPLLAEGVSTASDRDAIVRGLVLGYVPAPRTALASVRQVGPGEAWSLAPESSFRRYFAPQEQIAVDRSFEENAQLLDDVVTRAVERAVPAKGRIGAFLSGGLDSSLVLARLHEAGHDVDAFTLHFGDHLAGELRYATAVAKHLGVRHHVLELDARRFCDGIGAALEGLEDLLSEPISVPNFLLAREAARVVDVLFTGEGGDPPFGGPKNVGLALSELYRDVPGAPSLAEAYFTAHHHLADDLPIALTHEWAQSFDAARFAREIVDEHVDGRSGAPGETFVGRLMVANTVLKGGSNILVKAAKMLGAHDVAVRSPMFDVEVIRHAFTIPPSQKLRGTDEKLVLKAAAARSLPRCVLERSKRGMAVPLRAWLAGDLGVLARDVLTRRAVEERGIFRWSYVEALLAQKSTPSELARSRVAEKLWIVLVTELQQRTLARFARRDV